MADVMDKWGDVSGYLGSLADKGICPKLVPQVIGILDGYAAVPAVPGKPGKPGMPDKPGKPARAAKPGQADIIALQLTAVVDMGLPLVKATYTLEGNTLLTLITHDVLLAVEIAIRVRHWPNVEAITRARAAALPAADRAAKVAEVIEEAEAGTHEIN
jgi:hypothetical protein